MAPDATDEPGRRRIRVIVAEDDPFTLSLVADGLKSQGFEVAPALTVSAAWALVESTGPHALVSDLNFGGGESGASLLGRVHAEYPWIGLVVLTSHHSPALAVDDSAQLPTSVVYLVKSSLHDLSELSQAIDDSISGTGATHVERLIDDDTVFVTKAQAEVLRMLADGTSTRALAGHRGTTIRAVETMLARLYESLGIVEDDASNPRVAAVLLWQHGKVAVR